MNKIIIKKNNACIIFIAKNLPNMFIFKKYSNLENINITNYD